MKRELLTRDNPGRTFEKRDGYWYVQWRENGKSIRKLEHRWVWEQANGPIPRGYHIHHVDHNRTNNDLSNLQCMTAREHAQHHAEQVGKQTHESPEAARDALTEYNRQWREANREHRAEYNREYMRQYREDNRESRNEYQRQYRARKKLAALGS